MTPPLPLKPSKILLAKTPGLELDVLKSIASNVDVRCLDGRNPAAHQLSYAKKKAGYFPLKYCLSNRDPVIMVYQF